VNLELKIFAIKLIGTLIATPIMGWGIMVSAEKFEKAWKTNNRKKRWLACSGVFFFLAVIGGWLR
jgi:antibiotic biosynthesis monooxygenase (ABM) superfamily enzyme